MKKTLIIAGSILAIGILVVLGLTQRHMTVIVANSLQLNDTLVIKQYLDEILVEAGYDAKYIRTSSASELVLIREGKADIVPFRMDHLDEKYEDIIKIDEPLLEAISVLYVDNNRDIEIRPELSVGIVYGYIQSAKLAEDSEFETIIVYNSADIAIDALLADEVDGIILPWTPMSGMVSDNFPVTRIVLEHSEVFKVYLYINKAMEEDVERIAEAIRKINSSERYRDLVVIPTE